MQRAIIILTAATALVGMRTGADRFASAREARPDVCLVSLIEEVEIPARSQGVLVSIGVKEGNSVEKGALLAKTDDSQAQANKTIAHYQYLVALEQAENDVNVRNSRAAAKVAEAEYLEAVEANEKVPGSFTRAELRRRLFTQRRAELQIEQSEFDLKVAGMSQYVRLAEYKAAEEVLDRCNIEAPVDGVILKVYRHAGEWVNPGEPVLRIVSMSQLRVEGYLKADEYQPHEIIGRPVTIDAKLPHGRTERFHSTITFANPEVEASGEYIVRCEVTNRLEKAYWLLLPGTNVEMTIQLDDVK